MVTPQSNRMRAWESAEITRSAVEAQLTRHATNGGRGFLYASLHPHSDEQVVKIHGADGRSKSGHPRHNPCSRNARSRLLGMVVARITGGSSLCFGRPGPRFFATADSIQCAANSYRRPHDEKPPCPVCGQPISLQAVDTFRAFRCPHCHELLREERLGTSNVSATLLSGFALLLFLTGRVGWIGYLLILPTLLVIVSFSHTLAVRVFGYALEPVGRVGLGESDDEED